MRFDQVKRDRQQGYSLVEMSLVLVVIGLILGAASVGKDLQRNAEYKKIKQKFVDQWVQAYNQYYDRVGIVGGDNATLPTQAVARVAVTDAGDAADLDSGAFSSVTQTNVPALCTTGNGLVTGATADLREFFDDAGIELPPGRAANTEDDYLYLDSNGNPQQASVCFRWLVPGSLVGSGNTMIISGLTPDLAKFLDNAIDGRADGLTGRFRRSTKAATAADIASTAPSQWPEGNDFNDAGAGARTVDDQVQTVVAVYKMVQ